MNRSPALARSPSIPRFRTELHLRDSRKTDTLRRVRLSVIVVNWNSRDDLFACLSSLRAQSYTDLEVIVVDNGSTDGSIELVEEEFADYVLLAQGENLGFAEGCNRGIAASSGEWIALLNNDAIADPDWAQTLVDVAKRAGPRCGMLQSLMLFQDDDSKINSTGIELARSGGGRDRKEHQPRPAPGGPLEDIFCPTGGAAAYRRQMLEEIELPSGYLDRDHFCYYEDMDLGWRARLAGWNAIFVPQSIVRHRYHGSTRRRGKSWLIRKICTNRIRTLLKNASLSFIVKTSPRTVYDIGRLFWHGRSEAPTILASALQTGLAQRKIVSTLAQNDRRAIEKAWVR